MPRRLWLHPRNCSMQRQFRLAALVFERHRIEYFEQRFPLLIQSRGDKHQPLRRDDFLKNARHRIDISIRPAHVDANRSARPNIHFAHWIGETFRPPPALQSLRLCPRLKNYFARRVKNTSCQQLLHLFQLLAQAIQRLVRAFDGIVFLHHRLAFLSRLEQQPHRKPRFQALFGESNGSPKIPLRARIAVIVDQPFRLHDFEIRDLVRVVYTIRPVHYEPPNAAYAHVHGLRGDRKSSRPPPVPDVFGIGKCIEHQRARRIKQARDNDRACRLAPGFGQVIGQHIQRATPSIFMPIARFHRRKARLAQRQLSLAGAVTSVGLPAGFRAASSHECVNTSRSGLTISR